MFKTIHDEQTGNGIALLFVFSLFNDSRKDRTKHYFQQLNVSNKLMPLEDFLNEFPLRIITTFAHLF